MSSTSASPDIDKEIDDAYRKKIHEVKLKMLERLKGGEKAEGLDVQSLIGLKLLFPESFGGNGGNKGDSGGMGEITRLMMFRGMFPDMFQGKSSKEPPDDIDKELAKQAKISTLRLMQANAMSVNSPMGGQLVPAVDKEGKPMVDPYGIPVFRYAPGANVPSGTSDFTKELLLTEKERGDRMEEKMLDVIRESKDSRVGQLEQEVTALRSRDPVKELVDMADQLKEIGAFKVSSPENIEVVKYKSDMQKWMHEQTINQRRWEKEQDMKFRQWLEEQRARRDEVKQGREQIMELGKTLREGIKEVGRPLADAVGAGAKEGFKTPRRGGPGATNPSRASLNEMPTEQLHEQLVKAQEAKRLVEQAEVQLVQEIQRRQQATSSSTPKTHDEVKSASSIKAGAKNIR